MVDGKYWGFFHSITNNDKFFAFNRGKRDDGIYTIFSQTAKEQAENLQEAIPELIQFLNEIMTLWKYTSAMEDHSCLDNTITFKNSSDFLLYIDDTTYFCTIKDVRMDIGNSNNEGFYSISIYPKELYQDCCGYRDEERGIYIFYLFEAQYQ